MLENMMHMSEKKYALVLFVCLFVGGLPADELVSTPMLYGMWHTTPEKTSLGYMHHESDSNQSPEFRFVLLHLKDEEDTRESLVEIHRGHEGLQKGL